MVMLNTKGKAAWEVQLSSAVLNVLHSSTFHARAEIQTLSRKKGYDVVLTDGNPPSVWCSHKGCPWIVRLQEQEEGGNRLYSLSLDSNTHLHDPNPVIMEEAQLDGSEAGSDTRKKMQ